MDETTSSFVAEVRNDLLTETPPTKKIALLEYRKTSGTWNAQEWTRQELLRTAQGKCQQLFHTTVGALKQGDIRFVNTEVSSEAEPMFLVRMLAFFVNLNCVRALILPDRMLLFIPEKEEEVVLMVQSKIAELSTGILDSNLTFREELQLGSLDLNEPRLSTEEPIAKMDSETKANMQVISSSRGVMTRQRNSSQTVVGRSEAFELYTFEAVLWTAMKLLERDRDRLAPQIERITLLAMKDQSSSTLQSLRQIRKTTFALLSRAERELSVLVDLTSNDREMALMSFSNVLKNPEHYRSDAPHTTWTHLQHDMEMLLKLTFNGLVRSFVASDSLWSKSN